MIEYTYGLTIYRRGGRMWVNPRVLMSYGFESLPGAIEVADPSQLACALAQAVAQVRAHHLHPSFEGDPFFVVAGAATWDDFIGGLVSVEISRTSTATEIELGVPDEHMLVPPGPPLVLPPDASLADLARIALEQLAAYDRDHR